MKDRRNRDGANAHPNCIPPRERARSLLTADQFSLFLQAEPADPTIKYNYWLRVLDTCAVVVTGTTAYGTYAFLSDQLAIAPVSVVDLVATFLYTHRDQMVTDFSHTDDWVASTMRELWANGRLYCWCKTDVDALTFALLDLADEVAASLRELWFR